MSDVPTDEYIDNDLAMTISGYSPLDNYPEWGNASLREAYRAGWEAAMQEKE